VQQRYIKDKLSDRDKLRIKIEKAREDKDYYLAALLLKQW